MPQQKTNWFEVWKKGSIAFHQSEINPYLQKYCHLLQEYPHILFPLCGKTQDLHFLHEKGHQCSGVEMVESAVRDFFAEWGHEPVLQQSLQCLTHENISIYNQNIFSLKKNNISPIDAVYDRAALVAFHPELQSQYVAHLISLLPIGSKILLVTYTMPRPSDQGPPYSISQNRVQELYQSYAKSITLLEEIKQTQDDLPFLKKRNLEWMSTQVWIIDL